jgi:hypothetical protein
MAANISFSNLLGLMSNNRFVIKPGLTPVGEQYRSPRTGMAAGVCVYRSDDVVLGRNRND